MTNQLLDFFRMVVEDYDARISTGHNPDYGSPLRVPRSVVEAMRSSLEPKCNCGGGHMLPDHHSHLPGCPARPSLNRPAEPTGDWQIHLAESMPQPVFVESEPEAKCTCEGWRHDGHAPYCALNRGGE